MKTKRFDESGYQRKLRDPRWQQRRLKLLESANWTCQEATCKNWRHFLVPPQDRPANESGPPLEIHHLYYEWGREPWEYPDDAHLVLCDDCHERRAAIERQIKRDIVRYLRNAPMEMARQLFWEMLEKFNPEAAATVRSQPNGRKP